MSVAGLKPAIPASERPQTHALNCAATGIVRFMTSCVGCFSIWLQPNLLIYKIYGTRSRILYFV